MNETLLCSDTDYETAETMPEVKPLDQRKVLFEQLKGEYKLNELINEAKAQGVSRRSAIRWNDSWQENGMVIKTEYGHYKKSRMTLWHSWHS